MYSVHSTYRKESRKKIKFFWGSGHLPPSSLVATFFGKLFFSSFKKFFFLGAQALSLCGGLTFQILTLLRYVVDIGKNEH